jgi:ribonuclease HI
VTKDAEAGRMTEYTTSPIQWGVKIAFADGTVVIWYRDSKRRTVRAERNPHGHRFPPSADRLEAILAAVTGAPDADAPGPPWSDADGRPLGAFDGGADPNPGPGGWGVVLPDDRELCGGEPRTTNNRMELTGAIRLLEETRGPLRAGWRKRGWRTVSGSAVENLDLWERLEALVRGREVVWELVRGHSGHPLNERCDRLCAVGRRQVAGRRARRR